MQRERHDTEMLKSLQPGFVHKKHLYVNKNLEVRDP